MADKIYPKEVVKIITLKKEGYNSVSIVKETEDTVDIQLYNPNVKPEEKPEEAEEDK